MHDPPLHVLPPAQTVPHLPQFDVSLLKSASHPSPSAPLQLA